MSILTTLISFGTALLMADIVALYLGARVPVKGASRLVVDLDLRATTIGVTIVAPATTTPELFTTILGGLGYNSNFGLGATVSSDITNIGLILGISALIEPIGISTATLRRHVPSAVTAAVVLIAFGMNGNLDAVDDDVLLLTLVALTGYLLYRTRSATMDTVGAGEVDIGDEDGVSAWSKDVVYLVLSLSLLFVGLDWLIQGGQGLLESFGFGPRSIGLTVLASGTSLPELMASVISAVHGESESSIGSVVNSNIYNAIAVLDILAIMAPVNVPPSTISLNLPASLVFTLGVIALILRSRDVFRLDGGILVVNYLVFFWLIFP